jgi:hypothetical protein
VSFEVAEGWNAADIASELNRMAQEEIRIEDYRSYATEGGALAGALTGYAAWGISVYTKKNGTLFILKDSSDHDKVDAFFKSIRYGNFRFVSATSDGQTITLTREHR